MTFCQKKKKENNVTGSYNPASTAKKKAKAKNINFS